MIRSSNTHSHRYKNAPLAGAFLFLAILALLPAYICGQSPAPAQETAVKAERASDTNYLIGTGDVLDIRVYNRPHLSRESVRVDGQGMIRMPLIESDIKAVCRTDTDLAAEIAMLYQEYLRNPHVEVFIKDFQSKPVAVIGAVRDPGRFQLQRKVRLLELLSLAGGPTDEAGGRIQIKHDQSLRSCESAEAGSGPVPSQEISTTISDAGGSTTWYELSSLLNSAGADGNGNPFVRAGDIINVVEADRVYVVGNVFKPTIVPLKGPTTLTQALAIAGGVLPDTNLDKIRVTRQAPGSVSKTEYVVDLKAINKRRADDIVLQANDIVEVPSSASKKFVNSLLKSVIPGVARLPVRVVN